MYLYQGSTNAKHFLAVPASINFLEISDVSRSYDSLPWRLPTARLFTNERGASSKSLGPRPVSRFAGQQVGSNSGPYSCPVRTWS